MRRDEFKSVGDLEVLREGARASQRKDAGANRDSRKRKRTHEENNAGGSVREHRVATPEEVREWYEKVWNEVRSNGRARFNPEQVAVLALVCDKVRQDLGDDDIKSCQPNVFFFRLFWR